MTEDTHTQDCGPTAPSNFPAEPLVKDAHSSQRHPGAQDDALPEPPAIVDEESAAAYREKHHRGRSDPSCWYDSVKFVDRVAMHLFEKGWLAQRAAETGEGPVTHNDALEEFKKTWFKGAPPEQEMNDDTKRLAKFGVVLFCEGWAARLAYTEKST